MDLGRRLFELREAAGLTQAQLASRAGVTRNAVSQWEKGTTKPSTKRLAIIASALNVAVDEFVKPGTKVRERILEAATRAFESAGFDATSTEAICEGARVSRVEFETLFASKDALLCEVVRTLRTSALADIRRIPPRYGSLAARIKYLLHHCYVHDLARLKVTSAFQSYSWRWSEARERENNRDLLEFHEVIIALFDEAAAQGQIDAGNYRAASSMVLAAYQSGLRKAIFEQCDPDRLITFFEPQLTIILKGFNYRIVPGFAEGEASGG